MKNVLLTLFSIFFTIQANDIDFVIKDKKDPIVFTIVAAYHMDHYLFAMDSQQVSRLVAFNNGGRHANLWYTNSRGVEVATLFDWPPNEEFVSVVKILLNANKSYPVTIWPLGNKSRTKDNSLYLEERDYC